MEFEKSAVDTHVTVQEGAFASRDEEELAAIGKKQQLRVSRHYVHLQRCV